METSTNFDYGKVLFNIQRFQILQTKLNNQTFSLIPNSYAFAWYASVYPLLDRSDLHADLEMYFTISKEQVNSVIDYSDKELLAGRLYTFYEYEDYFGSNENNIARLELAEIFRYAFLHRIFNSKGFWEKLLEPMSYPMEVGYITQEFNIKDIELV